MKGKSIIIAAALCLIPFMGRSQSASIVYDPTSFGGILKQIYTDIQNHTDDIIMTEEQIETALSILETAEGFSAKMDEVYTKIQPVMSKTRLLYTVGNSIQSDYRALTETYESYARLFNEGLISADQFNRALRKTNSLMRIIKNDYDLISTALDSAMPTKDKMDVVQDAANESKMTAEEARADIKAIQDSTERARARAVRDTLMNSIMRSTPSKANSALNISWDGVVTEDEFEYSDTNDAAATLKESNLPLFALVEIILGIFFIISLAWGGLLYFKGDQQHQDALFKIALGLGFIVVVLEILKAVLF